VDRDVCFYDGQCGMCRRTTRLLRAVDWFGRLNFVDMTAIPPADLPVDPQAAMKGMPMRTRDGRILVGFPAVRRALAQTPLAPLAWLLYLPLISAAGAAAYRHIAAGRRRDCAVTPDLRAPEAPRILRS
jgi:predicted DCC family thiol-disulfide oxidoreductase YuxK